MPEVPDMPEGGEFMDFSHMEVADCGDQSHLHIVLYDEDHPVMQFTLEESEFRLLMDKCYELRGWGKGRN